MSTIIWQKQRQKAHKPAGLFVRLFFLRRGEKKKKKIKANDKKYQKFQRIGVSKARKSGKICRF